MCLVKHSLPPVGGAFIGHMSLAKLLDCSIATLSANVFVAKPCRVQALRRLRDFASELVSCSSFLANTKSLALGSRSAVSSSIGSTAFWRRELIRSWFQ